jgi:hypothetical protein
MGPAEGNPNLCFSLPQAFPPGDDGMEWIMGEDLAKFKLDFLH